MPLKLATFDVLIGEENYLNRGMGSQAIVKFLEKHNENEFDTPIFVDPAITNIAAIHAYQKAGFKKTKRQPNPDEMWMIREKYEKI